jgi:hypothetical protein
LENANFVLAETIDDKVNKFKGIGKAFDIYTKNPENKLIFLSLLPLEELKRQNEDNRELAFLLTQKNFKFLPMFDQEALKEFQEQSGFSFDKDIPT